MTDVPSGWTETTLGQIADNLDSKRVPVNRTERATRIGSIPYYGATGQVGWIDEPLFDEELCLVGEDGAPFLDRHKTKAYVIDGPSWVNNHAHVLRAVDGLTTNRFLKHTLDTIDYAQYVNGTTRLKLTKGSLNQIAIPLPPLNEQRRIVAAIEEHLSRLDAADASLAAAARRVVVLRHEALSSATAEGEERIVGDLLEGIEAGKSFKCHARRADPDEWGVIKVSAMTWGSFDESENKAVLSLASVNPRWEICPGDLLLSRANTTEYVGATVLVGECRPRLLLSDKSMRILVLPTVDKAWLRLALSSRSARAQMSAAATGTSDSMRNISQDKVKAVWIRVPALAEQRRIVARIEEQLSAIDALRAAIERARRRSASLRRAVLERAFRGELAPQDPSDEPASLLLERLRGDCAQTPGRARSASHDRPAR